MDFESLTVDNFTRVVQVDMKAGAYKKMPNRTSEGLIVVLRGELVYVHNGVEYVSNPDNILLMPRGITYHLKSITDSSNIVINFNLQNPSVLNSITYIKSRNGSFSTKIERLWTFKKSGYNLKCLSILYDFFADQCKENSYLPMTKFKKIQPGIKYIEDHLLDTSLRDEKLAEVSGISKTYFRSIFIKQYGIPPMKYVRQKRIERAKQILNTGYYESIGDVAVDSGFNDIYCFCKAFKKETSLTPTEYAIRKNSR